MTGSVALDVVIGLVFIYMIYSLLASVVAEAIADIIRLRAKNLELYIRFMLTFDNKVRIRRSHFLGSWLANKLGFSAKRDNNLFNQFLSLPSIKNLSRKRWIQKSGPSYMEATTFVNGLIDVLVQKQSATDELSKIEAGIEDMTDQEQDVQSHLKRLLAKSNNDLVKFRAELAYWYESTMARCASNYKQLMQIKLFVLGFVIAVGFNLNIISIAKTLANDEVARAQIVAMAQKAVKEDSSLKKIEEELDNYNENAQKVLGIGWDEDEFGWCTFWSGFWGFLLAALGISLGAPFWFDMLNKLMKVRSAVNQEPEKSGGKAKNKSKTETETVG